MGLTLRETPASVSSFSRADMAERSITRVQDAVVRLPGMTESPAPGNGGTRLAARVQHIVKYSPVTGRVGAVWLPEDALSLYGQFGTGTDPVSGAMSLPGGTDTFDLTKGRQWEIGAKGLLPAVHGEWTAALYRIEKRNLLSRDTEDPNVVQQVGQQSSTGIELAFAAEPVRDWTVDANATFFAGAL